MSGEGTSENTAMKKSDNDCRKVDADESKGSLKKIDIDQRKFFECADCGLHEEYDYFGKNPPFCRSITFVEDSFVARDPFTAHSGNNANFLLLGSKCAICSRVTCQECSIFFTKRFCSQCTLAYSAHLPEELRARKKVKD